MPIFEVTLSGVKTIEKTYSATVQVTADTADEARMLAHDEALDWEEDRGQYDGDAVIEQVMVIEATQI